MLQIRLMLMASNALFAIALLTRNADGKTVLNKTQSLPDIAKGAPMYHSSHQQSRTVTHPYSCWPAHMLVYRIALQQVTPIPQTLPDANTMMQLQNRQSNADTNQPKCR